MEQQRLVLKIFDRVNAFQQGFEILSDARSLPALAENFHSILKEQIRLSTLNLWYKPNQALAGAGWPLACAGQAILTAPARR